MVQIPKNPGIQVRSLHLLHAFPCCRNRFLRSAPEGCDGAMHRKEWHVGPVVDMML